tara:strand:- start:14999 stop:15958 length:960 start_codon:yes stop_codon:yes gene_type:complete
MFKVPILIIGFNRPDYIKKQITVLRQIKPRSLYITIDAPRRNNEEDAKKVDEVKSLIDQECDWDVKLFKNYAISNLGCGPGPVSGIDWFFEHVEEGIILEDDCIADLSFFTYCEELLEKYRSDSRVMTISGSCYPLSVKSNEYSYSFSSFIHIWGWATWRRAWKHFDIEIKEFPGTNGQKAIRNTLQSSRAIHEWQKRFLSVFGKGKAHIWDYQWMFASWLKGGITIHPKVNMIDNIGFGEDSTHTKDRSKSHAMTSGSITFPLSHPEEVKVDSEVDFMIQDKIVTPHGFVVYCKYLLEICFPSGLIKILKNCKQLILK